MAGECREYILLPRECREIGLKNLSSCKNYLSLDEECRQRGMGKDECDRYLSMPLSCREAGIIEQEACNVFIGDADDALSSSSLSDVELEDEKSKQAVYMVSEYTVFAGVIIVVAMAVFTLLFILMKIK